MHIKWAKNLQRSDQFHVIRLPIIHTRLHMCPSTLVAELLKVNQFHKHAPLIAVRGVPLTKRKLCERLHVILRKMGLDKCGLTLHAFRRSGASLAFAQEILLEAIRAHGAWASDAVWQYFKHTDQVTAIVPSVLCEVFK